MRCLAKCRKCSVKHHMLLHFDSRRNTSKNSLSKADFPTSVMSRNSAGEQKPLVTLTTRTLNINTEAVLAIVLLQVVDRSGFPVICRAVLDSASQSRFISVALRNRLNLSSITSESRVQVLHN